MLAMNRDGEHDVLRLPPRKRRRPATAEASTTDRACAIHILLRQGWQPERIAPVVGVHPATVYRHRAGARAARLAAAGDA